RRFFAHFIFTISRFGSRGGSSVPDAASSRTAGPTVGNTVGTGASDSPTARLQANSGKRSIEINSTIERQRLCMKPPLQTDRNLPFKKSVRWRRTTSRIISQLRAVRSKELVLLLKRIR